MKKIVFTIFLSVIAYQLFCQVDKSVVIARERSMLLEKFLVNDMEKVKEIKNYLIEEVEDRNYIALYPVEQWLILYWTNEFEELLFNIKNYNPKKFVSNYGITMYSPNAMTRLYSLKNDTRIAPLQKYRLFNTLLQYLKENEEKIITQIQYSDMNTEEKRFLQLHFENLIKKNNKYQDTLNMKGKSFLEAFPVSQYNDFIRNHIMYKFVLDDRGFAYELFWGYGLVTGDLSNKYKEFVHAGIAFEYYYKKIEIILRLYGGGFITINDLKYTKGYYSSGINTFFYDLSIGFTAFENHRIKLAPFSGFGALYFFPPSSEKKKNPDSRELSVASYTFNCGISFDVRLTQKPNHSYTPIYGDYFVRIRYNFGLPILSNNLGSNGQMHSITFGFGMYVRKFKRDY